MDADRPGRVIVGIDPTLSGLHALRVAVAEARVRGAPLHAVRTWDPPAPEPGPPSGVRPEHWRGPTDPGAAEAAAIVARAFADTMGGEPADIYVHTVVVPDSPGRVLVEYACRDRDLLVVGTGRRRRLGRRWRGGVARYCVTRAGCPVLVVPPPPLARTESPRALLRQLRREIDQLADGEPGR